MLDSLAYLQRQIIVLVEANSKRTKADDLKLEYLRFQRDSILEIMRKIKR